MSLLLRQEARFSELEVGSWVGVGRIWISDDKRLDECSKARST